MKDKVIPISVALTFAGQLIFGIWFISGLSHRLEFLESRVEDIAEQHDTVIRIEEKITAIEKQLTVLVDKINQ